MSTRSVMHGATRTVTIRSLSVLVVLLLLVPGNLPFLPGPVVRAQNNPPPFGEGDWIINTPTMIWNQSLTIHGRLLINSGGSLTLDHTVLIILSPAPYLYNITAFNGSSLSIINGSYVGSGDDTTAFQVAPLSHLLVRNSTISGFGGIPISPFGVIIEDSKIISDGDGLGIMGGSVVARRSSFTTSSRGIWMSMGHLELYDSEVSDNGLGIYMYPNYPCGGGGEYFWPPWSPPWIKNLGAAPCGDVRFTDVYRTRFERDSGIALSIQFSNLYMKDSLVQYSSYTAVFANYYYSVVIEDTDISHHDGLGILMQGGGPKVILKNVNVTDCHDYAYLAQSLPGVDIDWYADADMHVDSVFEGNVIFRAVSGGHIVMDSVNLMALGDLRENVVAENGGRIDIYNSTLGKAGELVGLSAYAGGNLSIHNSTLAGAGPAVESGGNLIVENSTVQNSASGIVVTGGRAAINDTLIVNCGLGVKATGGVAKMFDSNIFASSNKDIDLGDGQLQTYDTNFTSVLPETTTGSMQVFWSARVRSMWGNGATIENATINIAQDEGTQVWTGTSGTDGLTGRTYLRQYILDSSGTHSTTPHHVKATYKGMTNTTPGLVEKQTILPVYLEDHILPKINVTSPGLDVHQTNTTLVVNGTASDNESGIDRIQWSLDQDLWTDAEGLGTWNFSTVLSFSSRDLYLRAMDRAGNAANLTMHITVDKTAPFLYILSPKDGFLTKLRTVLIEGRTEYGATVTIKNQSVVCVDGLFRLSVPIDEGENKIVVVSKDDTDNTNTSRVTVFRDTTPPPITITKPPENYITNKKIEQNLPVTGFTEIGAKLMSQGRFISVGDDGSFYFTFGLQEGTNVLDLVAEDFLGNQNSTVRHVIYDITIPNMTLLSPPDGTFTNRTNVTIIGMSEGLANISAKSANFTSLSKADPAGRFEITIKLSEGLNAIQVTAIDRAGNSRTKTLNIYSDTIAPDMTFGGIKDGMVTDLTSIIVEGQTEANARIKFNGNILPVGVSGRFGATLELFSANNTFTFEATDKAGNSKVVTLHIKRKATAEPKPTGAGAAIDYLPWLVLLLLIIVAVQWTVITRSSMLKARKKNMEAVSPQAQVADEAQYPKAPQQRKEPRRPRQGGQVVVNQNAPEFDIEYGDRAQYVPGGGRK